MRVTLRIRTAPEKWIVRSRRPNRRLAYLGASVFWPLALCSFFLCLWRWSYDLAWTARFPIPAGVFSHWQIWFLAGTLLQVVAVRLVQYAETESAEAAVARAGDVVFEGPPRRVRGARPARGPVVAGSNPVIHPKLL
ncbi:MAG TPA: hypothetical protein VEU62_18160 [Bryobacterales bacterium]|nr:hypothetical protein [Bryobacterales bacterium]